MGVCTDFIVIYENGRETSVQAFPMLWTLVSLAVHDCWDSWVRWIKQYSQVFSLSQWLHGIICHRRITGENVRDGKFSLRALNIGGGTSGFKYLRGGQIWSVSSGSMLSGPGWRISLSASQFPPLENGRQTHLLVLVLANSLALFLCPWIWAGLWLL